MRILLADHDESFVESVQCFLWDRGHEAEVALNGLECILTMREFVPAVLVLDQNVLWGGSRGVVEWMTSQPGFICAHLIMTYREELAEDWSIPGEMPVDWLRKPYSFGELLTLINSIDRRMRPQYGTARVSFSANESIRI